MLRKTTRNKSTLITHAYVRYASGKHKKEKIIKISDINNFFPLDENDFDKQLLYDIKNEKSKSGFSKGQIAILGSKYVYLTYKKINIVIKK